MTLQPISKKSNTTCYFPAEAQGRGVNTPPASCNKTAHTDDRINLSQSSRSSQRPRPVRDRGNTQKSLPFIIGRDFLQNVTVKLLSLCELSVLCERPLHIPGFMQNTVLSKSTVTGPRLIGSKNYCCCSGNTAGLTENDERSRFPVLLATSGLVSHGRFRQLAHFRSHHVLQ